MNAYKSRINDIFKKNKISKSSVNDLSKMFKSIQLSVTNTQESIDRLFGEIKNDASLSVKEKDELRKYADGLFEANFK